MEPRTHFTAHSARSAALGGLLGLLLLGTSRPLCAANSTPNLSLSASAVSANQYQVTLTLNDSAGDGNQLAAYDTNIFIDNTYFTFVPQSSGRLYTPLDTADFPNLILNPTSATNDLRVSYGADFPGATNHASVALGYFTVQTVSPLPAAGTTITLGSTTPGSDTANSGGSDLDDFITFANVLQSTSNVTITPAPEPGGVTGLLVGAAALGLLAVRRRARRANPV